MLKKIKLESTDECMRNVLNLVGTGKNVFIDNDKINIGCSKFSLGSILIKNSEGELFVKEDNWDRKVFF